MSDTDIIAQLRSDGSALCVEAAAEIQRLRDRVRHFEALAQAESGTPAKPEEPDDPFRVEHDIPPNAPR